jgi:hypothetical protein
MDFRRLGNILIAAGAAIVAASLVWWFLFYRSVIREVARASGGQGEGSVLDAASCIYSSSGACAFVSGIAQLAGKTPYEPKAFWFGLAALVVGVVIRVAVKPAGAS